MVYRPQPSPPFNPFPQFPPDRPGCGCPHKPFPFPQLPQPFPKFPSPFPHNHNHHGHHHHHPHFGGGNKIDFFQDPRQFAGPFAGGQAQAGGFLV